MKPEERYRAIVLMILPLVLSACQSQLTVEPKATMTPSPIPVTETPQPTSTATPFPTPTPTPDYPEQAGNIVETEVHEGRLFGIDDSGLATIVLNGNEWEMYERPVLAAGATAGAYREEISAMIEEIDWDFYMQEMRENRLHDTQGNPIPFGYLFETPPQGENPGIAYLSGFVTDYYAREIAGAIVDSVAFIIPQRYENQVAVFYWNENPGARNDAYILENSMIPNSEVDERPSVLIPTSFTNVEVGRMFRSELQGKQVVLGIAVDWPDPWMQARNILNRMLIESIVSGDAIQLYMEPIQCNELWLPDLQE